MSFLHTCFQVMHVEELEEKKRLMKRASDVDDMYDLLAVHQRKVGVSLVLTRC